MAGSVKARVFEIVEGTRDDDPVGHAFGLFIVTLIGLNVVAFMLDSVESVRRVYHPYLLGFEYASVAVFTAEYLLRLWAITASPRYARPVTGRVRWMFTPLAIVDVLAIAPTYLIVIGWPAGLDLRFVRVLRFFRMLRLFKLSRYSESLRTLASVLRSKREELGLALVVVAVLLLLTSSFMYHAEHEAQPDKFSSIPASMWWAIITLTTIGYGDVYPVTNLGKALGAITALLGIGMVALPTAILASGFLEEIQKRRREKGQHLCPHCGRDVDHPPEQVQR